MKIQIKNKELAKSLKNFRPYTHVSSRIQQKEALRSSVDEKMNLLKKPVYDRKKILKKSSLSVIGNEKPKTAAYHTHNCFKNEEKTKEDQIQLQGHYQYRSHNRKTSYQSWFKKTSLNLQQNKNKKNIVDVVVLEKQIQRDSIPIFEKNSSMINLRQKTSKSLNGQDSQSLLRKNSLYLLNFIKRKQNLKKQEPHIGGIPNLAQNIPINHSPSKIIKYVPSKNENKKKPQKMIPTFSKIIANLPIDPW